VSNADLAAAARRLRLAALASMLVSAIIIGVSIRADRLGISHAFQVAAACALAAAEGWLTLSAIRVAARAPTGVRATLALASVLMFLGFGTTLILAFLIQVGAPLWMLNDPIPLAFTLWVLWAGGRAGLWIGLLGMLERLRHALPSPLIALVPLLVGARIILLVAQLVAPLLEAGSEWRQHFLDTATARVWLTVGVEVSCNAAIAWLAGRAARAA
jgi:hypothetical protein